MDLTRVTELIRNFQGRRVAVVGDLILDRYMYGKADRISFEAPVPVVCVQKRNAVPGGAANVVRNLAALGACPLAFGVVGADAAADEMRNLLKNWNAGLAGVLSDSSRQTTVKTRVIADRQQVVRIDDESCETISAAMMDQLLAELTCQLNAGGVDAIILEDYNKGVLGNTLANQIQALAAEHGVICLLDPHPANTLKVCQLDLMTPNRAESFALVGEYFRDTVLPIEQDQALQRVALKLFDSWQPRNLLITLGAGGMALFGADGALHHIPTVAREVFDVSGAGDSVIATCTLAMLAGASMLEAAELANHAGGIVVGKLGTVTVTADELLAGFRKQSHD